jgi:hypothetical protein
MKTKRIEGSTCYGVEHDGATLTLCPCCGEPFRTRLAAEAVRELLRDGGEDWADALRVERAGIRGLTSKGIRE